MAPPRRVFPPGFRFCPTDVELIVEYLRKRINEQPIEVQDIHETYIYDYNPQELAEKHASLGDRNWYFFTSRRRKYPKGSRPNRSCVGGYWKATGADKHVKCGDTTVGYRKALVFYTGKDHKTDWIMHEYRIQKENENENENAPVAEHEQNNMLLDPVILCRIYQKKQGKGKRPATQPVTRPSKQLKAKKSKATTRVEPRATMAVASADDFSTSVPTADHMMNYRHNFPRGHPSKNLDQILFEFDTDVVNFGTGNQNDMVGQTQASYPYQMPPCNNNLQAGMQMPSTTPHDPLWNNYNGTYEFATGAALYHNPADAPFDGTQYISDQKLI